MNNHTIKRQVNNNSLQFNSIQFNSIPLFYLFVEYVNNSMRHTYKDSELFSIAYHTIRKDSRKAQLVSLTSVTNVVD